MDIHCIQYCAKVTQANFDKINFLAFHGFLKKFRFKRKFRDFSANFRGTYRFIPPAFSNDNSRWTLTSQEISRGSSLFSIVSHAIAGENSLLISVLIQAKQNTTTVRDLLLCKEK